MTLNLRLKKILPIATLAIMCAWPLAAETTSSGTAVPMNSSEVNVSNDWYQISLLGKTRQFSVRTADRHSAGSNLNVIYHQDSSFFTIRAFSATNQFIDYVQGDLTRYLPSGQTTDAKQLVLKSATRFEDGFRVIYKTHENAQHKLEVIQDIRLEGLAANTSSVRVTTRVTSLSATTKRVAIRYLWDFEVGSDDGPALLLNDGTEVVKERVFEGPTMKYFAMQDNEKKDGQSRFRVRATVDLDKTGPYATKPTQLTHACWETAKLTSFDYPVTSGSSAKIVSNNSTTCDNSGTGGDNAMLYYFGHDYESAWEISKDRTRIFTAYLAKEIVVDADFDRTDSDGDGLYDVWETAGVDLNGDGTPEYTLTGADKDTKNLYIYYDWVGDNKPSAAILQRVVNTFKEAPVDAVVGDPQRKFKGILLHFKEGKKVESVFGESLDANIGETNRNGVYDWDEFSAIKAENFPTELWPTHRYMLLADAYGGANSTGSSGIARGILSSDFMVTVGGWSSTGEKANRELANTILHELGHTLALRHGGFENAHRKPNYLSVMNYLFQLDGIPHEDGIKSDYSRFGTDDLRTLNETSLDESSGLVSATNSSEVSKYRTTFACLRSNRKIYMSNKPINQSIDWNCDDSISASPVESDVNPSSGKSRSLAPYDDWPNLQFDGGAIGELGAVLTLAATTDLKRAAEPTEEEFKAFKRGEFVDNSEVFFLLKNGSFERPYDATQDHYVIYFRNESNNPLESWTVNGSSGASFALFDREQFQSLTPAHENHYLGFWGTLLGIHQTVSTEIGAEYVLTFALSWTNGSPAGHGMTVLLNDEPASTYSFGEETGERGPWEYLTLRFTAQSAQTKIEFRSQRPETSRTGLLLDGVHLEFELDEH